MHCPLPIPLIYLGTSAEMAGLSASDNALFLTSGREKSCHGVVSSTKA